MIKHPWKCNYAATLSPEILHFQNFVVFFWEGKHAIRPPMRGQKNYLLAASLYFGSYRSPFFHTYRVDSSGIDAFSVHKPPRPEVILWSSAVLSLRGQNNTADISCWLCSLLRKGTNLHCALVSKV